MLCKAMALSLKSLYVVNIQTMELNHQPLFLNLCTHAKMAHA
jgi:hypothetical protein